jgi:uncharacterized membrane protein (DUF485 family)
MSAPESLRRGRGGRYQTVHSSPEFRDLQRKFRRFVVPVVLLFLTWYFAFVLLAAFAPGLMGTPVIGRINLGLILGLGQFVSTFAIAAGYGRWARRHLDPQAKKLRDDMERSGLV